MTEKPRPLADVFAEADDADPEAGAAVIAAIVAHLSAGRRAR